jgi:hypothetical protein
MRGVRGMKAKWIAAVTAASLLSLASLPAHGADAVKSDDGETAAAIGFQDVAKIVPGKSTKADIQALLGAPWRVVQFNDCGMAMDGQADETWEYRGNDPNVGFRVHVEFDDNGVVHLVAKISNGVAGGTPTVAKIAPGEPSKDMSM